MNQNSQNPPSRELKGKTSVAGLKLGAAVHKGTSPAKSGRVNRASHMTLQSKHNPGVSVKGC